MIAVISWRKIAPDKKGAWQKTSLAAGGEGVIGRARSSLICLEDIRVSRKHVSVAIKNGAVHITDHGSANGAFLDGQSFESSVWSPGQRLQIADFEFQLEIEQGQPRAKTVSRGGHPIGGGVDDDAYAAAQALIAEARRGGVPLGGVAAVTPEAVAPQAAAVRSPTRPSQRMKLNRVPALVPMGWLVQMLMLLGIVVTSVVMTVRVILLSVATKTSAVESKAKEALSIFGIDLSKVLDENSDVTESFSNAVDPWSFAWDMDAYRGLVVASIVIYVACFAAFVIWHYLVDRSIPFRQSRGIFSRVLNGPLVWFVPVANLIQPPRVIGRVYGFASLLDPIGTTGLMRGLLIWIWWIALLCGVILSLLGQSEAPETLNTVGVLTMIVAPIMIIASSACAVVLVRDLTGRIQRGAAGAP